jgi:hypothetical protein
MDCYAFRTEEQGGGPGPAVEGKYQKGQPAWFRAADVEFYRDGDRLAYRHGGRWLRSRTGILSDPLPVLAAAAAVRGARLPHEELAGLDGHLQDVGPAEGADRGGSAYAARLDAEAARVLARSEHRAVARGGTVRLWVDAGGHVTKYEIRIRLQGRLGDAEVDGTATRSVTLSGRGSTRVEVPAAARKALE